MENPKPSPPRRIFLKQAAGLAGASPLPPGIIATAAVAGAAALPANAADVAPLPAGHEFFSPDEATFVEALVNVMCPADELSPNGVDAGIANRSLNAYLADPQQFVPDNLMPFSGIAEASQRADLIAYLKTLK